MTINLDFVSDFVCPWCWLGLRRLQAAVEEYGAEKVQLKFRPFQLDAGVPLEGADYKDYMSQKFGPTEPDNKWEEMRRFLIDAGVKENIPFNFGELSIRPNSFNAHRLMRWAQGQGQDVEAADAIFHAYFSENKNIGDIPTLMTIGDSLGIMPDVLNTLFNESSDKTSLQEEEMFFRNLGITGVPVVIAGGQKAIMGAQETDVYLEFLKSCEQAN